MTNGVNYRPSAVPIAHCPPARTRLGQYSCTLLMRAAAVANSGPIIQGSGAFSHTHTFAAIRPSSRVVSKGRTSAREKLCMVEPGRQRAATGLKYTLKYKLKSTHQAEAFAAKNNKQQKNTKKQTTKALASGAPMCAACVVQSAFHCILPV